VRNKVSGRPSGPKHEYDNVGAGFMADEVVC
jgi:hypothetical protein